MNRLLPILLFGLPSIAFAAPTTYNLLAPLGPLTGGVTLGQYLEGIVQVIIGIAGVLAVVMIVICAIQMMGSPSVSQKSASKECIANALFGLLLAIGSWIILNTINADLLKSNFNLATLSGPVAPTPPAPTSDPMPTKPGYYYRYDSGGGIIKNSPLFNQGPVCAEQEKRAQNTGVIISQKCFSVLEPTFAPAGNELTTRNTICGNNSCIGATPVAIKQGPCPTNIGNCVRAGFINVAGLPMTSINGIKALASGSGVNVVITGGTESGHTTHFPNKPIFDLRKTKNLDSYIRTNSTQSAKSFSSWCRYRVTLAGTVFWFTNEGDHWHVDELNQAQWYSKDSDKSGNPLPGGFNPTCPQ